MSQQIKKKFIEGNAIDGSKIQILNDEALRIKKLGGSDQEVFKLDVTDKLQFLISPRVSVDPTDSDELARKGYVDQKIADLVASAPAVLDTLKELADAIGDDPNFATTVAGQVSTVQSNLDSEISRATTAEGGLQSQINALSSSSSAALAQEILDRQAADTAEASARSAEDLTMLKLDGSRAMSGHRDMANQPIINAPEISAAGSISLTASSSNMNLQGSQMEMKTEDPATTIGAYFAGYSLDQPQPQLNYELYNSTTGDDAWVYLNLDADQGSANLDIGAYSSSTSQSTTLTMDGAGATFSSGSTTLQVQQVGINLQGNVSLQPGSTVNLGANVLGNIGNGSVSSDAVNKGQLDAAISSVSSGSSAALTQEISDRQAADAAIQSELDATQVGAGLGVDGGYSAPVGSNYLGSAVSLKDADSKLDAQVKVVADSLASEITNRIADVDAEESRAMAAESALDSRLDVLEADPTTKTYVDQKVADLVNGAPALLDTLKELADAINDDPSFATTVANSVASVQSNLTQEISDRIADVDAEESRAMGVEASLQSQITQEISDRIADVNAEESRAMGVEASLQSQITQEVSDRQADVNAEESRAMGVEASLQSQITQEISDRQADVTAEETRAMAAESALDARVVALEGVAVNFASDKFVLSAGDISNGYITLGTMDCIAGSINAFVDRLAIFETDDYTISTVGGYTRLTFVGSLVTPGQEKLSAGDVVRVKYAYGVL